MHQTALKNIQKFYDKYCISDTNFHQKTILEIGSFDHHYTLRSVFNKCHKYIGLDLNNGPNVDIVSSSHNIPLDNNSIDVVVSSSCFEHDPIFWITFLEICRVIKSNGLIYICAPSSGPYHPEQCPGDSWRFYPDSWTSLCLWANYNNYNLKLIDSYIDTTFIPPDQDWKDSIGIFYKH